MEKDADTWDKFQHCLTSFESDNINSDDQELLNQIQTENDIITGKNIKMLLSV